MIIEVKEDSWFFKYDEVLIDTVKGTISDDITNLEDPYMIKPLVNNTWEDRDSSVLITPDTSNFSQFEGLTFNMVIDSANELNEVNKFQQFTLEVKDSIGNIARIIFPENLNALGYTPRKLVHTSLGDEDIYYWSTISPITSINIPLAEFESIDLEKIESISLIFDKINSGSIYIESIYLQ